MGSDSARERGDKPASILTPSQRQYLQGERDVTDSAERAIRSRIRQRLRAGMTDFFLLLRELGVEDIQSALEMRKGVQRGELGEEGALDNGMSSAIGIIHLAGLERLHYPGDAGEGGRITHTRFVESRAKKGVRLALNRLGYMTKKIDVDIDIDLGEDFESLANLDADALAERSEFDLHQARLEGAISREQFMAALDAKEAADVE